MSSSYVRVFYGPCGWPPEHKPQKLNGLRNHLRCIGFRVDLEPVDAFNYCMLEMCGYSVFRCNINSFKFNITWKRDPVCLKAIAAVQEASKNFNKARIKLWAWNVIDDAIFKRNEYSCNDYWVSEDTKIPEFELKCKDCLCRKDELLIDDVCVCDLEKCTCTIKDCRCDLEICVCNRSLYKKTGKIITKGVCTRDLEVNACHSKGCHCDLEVGVSKKTREMITKGVCTCDLEVCTQCNLEVCVCEKSRKVIKTFRETITESVCARDLEKCICDLEVCLCSKLIMTEDVCTCDLEVHTCRTKACQCDTEVFVGGNSRKDLEENNANEVTNLSMKSSDDDRKKLSFKVSSE